MKTDVLCFFRVVIKIFLVSFIFMSLIGCAKVVDQKDLYTFHSEYVGTSVPRNIQVERSLDGAVRLTSLDDKSSIPMGPSLTTDGVVYYPDAPGASNVLVKINPAVGYTTYAGLKFTGEINACITDGGIVQLDKRNVIATDHAGISWISKKVKLNSIKMIAFVKNK